MRVSGKPMSLVIDTNVWVDYFLNKELDRGASKCLLECAVKNDVPYSYAQPRSKTCSTCFQDASNGKMRSRENRRHPTSP